MSVSLVVLRLEVPDEVYPPNLHYRAHGSPGESTLRPSYAAITSGQPVATNFTQEDSCHFWGRRKPLELIIETFHTEVASLVEMEAAVPPIGEDKSWADHVSAAMETMYMSAVRSSEGEASREATPSSTPREVTCTPSPRGEGAIPKHDCANSPKLDNKTTLPKDQGLKSRRLRGEVDTYGSVVCRSASPLTDDCEMPDRPSSAGKMAGRGQSPLVGPTSIHFFSGNPSVERTEGIIHLYKNNQMTSLTDDISRSEMICILTVPAGMTSQDLLQFIAPVEPWVENLKIIRDNTPNMYMVLVKFRGQKYADEFYTTFNNQPFNSIEPETCHLVYVAQVETVKSSEGGSLPVSGLTELPVCPVCLERMDESVDGILTILCNHSFHSACLSKWGDTTCPVCRYVQTPELVEDQVCFECNSQESLWICLVCGHVGCGRYVGGHAYSHFTETHHTYSMQLGNNRVWDYAGDNYVHRLVQNKSDGKLVQLDEGGNVVQDDEKLDSITLEYTYLLTSQLESQRRYFEEKLEHIEKDALKQVEEVELRSKKAMEECSKLESQLAGVTKDRHALEKKCTQMNARMSKLCSDLSDEKEMNKSLLTNQSQWQERVTKMEQEMAAKDKTMTDLQEQLRDVMFYLEAQQKLANTKVVSQEEIQEGHVIIGASGGTPGGKKARKKGR